MDTSIALQPCYLKYWGLYRNITTLPARYSAARSTRKASNVTAVVLPAGCTGFRRILCSLTAVPAVLINSHKATHHHEYPISTSTSPSSFFPLSSPPPPPLLLPNSPITPFNLAIFVSSSSISTFCSPTVRPISGKVSNAVFAFWILIFTELASVRRDFVSRSGLRDGFVVVESEGRGTDDVEFWGCGGGGGGGARLLLDVGAAAGVVDIAAPGSGTVVVGGCCC